ncbi:MAG: hypothetical protein AB7R00_20635 [Kofleriaceae bacterium]
MTRAFVLASLMLAITPASTHAQPGPAQAEVLFDRGKALLAQGKTSEACAAFESSQKLDPQITTLLNLGDCREKNKQLASAWGHFVEAERQTRGGSGGLRKLNEVAKQRASKLAPRMPKLTINVPRPVPGLEVTRNGQIIDAGAMNAALPVDGGTFKIAARAPGYESWSTTIIVAVERDQKVVDVPMLAKPNLSTTMPEDDLKARSAAQPDVRATAEPDKSRGTSRIVPIGLSIAGGVLAVGVIGLELWARATYDKAVVEPNDAEQESLWQAANTRRYAAIGTGVVAAGCVGVAVYMFTRAPARSAENATASAVNVRPVIGIDVAGVLISGNW